jgi:Trk-type K+ transport systems, membrane components
LNNSEFKLYTKLFLLVAGIVSAELWLGGSSMPGATLNGVFQSAALISSTGFSTMSLTALSIGTQAVFIALMFVGGSLGSTSGGLKVFRLKTMVELLRTRIRSYTLPETAINEVKIDGEILEKSTVRTISVLFFTWISFFFLLTLASLFLGDMTLKAAISGSVSSIGNMGPVFMPTSDMIAISPFVKIVWIFGMLAGRLEMLPILAIFNSDLFASSN